MTLEQALAFFVFSMVAAVTPGPSNVMLTATGAAVGIARGLPCLLGVAAGMGLLMFAVALGFGALLADTPVILHALKWIGAAFLLWLAWKIATAGAPDAAARREPVGFVGAALFQWINPKSWLVATSAVATYVQPPATALAAAAVFVAAALPSGLIWLALGASIHRLLQSPRAVRIFNVALGLSLAASIALIL